MLSIAGFGLVQQQFFPSANRPELVVDLWLPSGASIVATEREAKRFEKVLEADPDVESYVVYVGGGSPRFYLPLDQQLFNANLAEFVVTTKSNEVRDAVAERLLDNAGQRVHPAARARATRCRTARRWPIRCSSASAARTSPSCAASPSRSPKSCAPTRTCTTCTWTGTSSSKVVRLEIDQNKARLIGVTSAGSVQRAQLDPDRVQHHPVPRARQADRSAGAGRAAASGAAWRTYPRHQRPDPERAAGSRCRRSPPSSYGFEEGLIWRRNREPTITVQGDIVGDIQAPVVSKQIDPQLDAMRAKLPPGYRIEMGGAIEESARGQASVNAVMPIMLLTVVTLLMLHLQSMQKTILVLLTAPLGLIGVTLFLLVFRVPFGFVAMLGVIALSGMIMRNSIILVDQIDQDLRGRALAVGRGDRIHRAPLPADPAHRGGRDPGDDSAHPQQLLGSDGGGDHGRAARGHRAHAAVPARAVRGVVQSRSGREAVRGRGRVIGYASRQSRHLRLRSTRAASLQPASNPCAVFVARAVRHCARCPWPPAGAGRQGGDRLRASAGHRGRARDPRAGRQRLRRGGRRGCGARRGGAVLVGPGRRRILSAASRGRRLRDDDRCARDGTWARQPAACTSMRRASSNEGLSLDGALAAGIPGTPAGLAWLAERYGTPAARDVARAGDPARARWLSGRCALRFGGRALSRQCC